MVTFLTQKEWEFLPGVRDAWGLGPLIRELKDMDKLLGDTNFGCFQVGGDKARVVRGKSNGRASLAGVPQSPA